MMSAYDTFARATETGALKVVISADGAVAEQALPVLAGASA